MRIQIPVISGGTLDELAKKLIETAQRDPASTYFMKVNIGGQGEQILDSAEIHSVDDAYQKIFRKI
jgi:hypothetical protein